MRILIIFCLILVSALSVKAQTTAQIPRLSESQFTAETACKGSGVMKKLLNRNFRQSFRRIDPEAGAGRPVMYAITLRHMVVIYDYGQQAVES
jgi:hypothetical protein